MKEKQLEPGAVFKHWRGDLYSIVTLARMENNSQLIVVYAPLEHPELRYARAYTDFVGEIEEGVPRFAPYAS